MANEPRAPQARRADRGEVDGAPEVRLRGLSYRSRTVAPMSELDLHRLARAAQMRNRFEGVTGMLVYDGGWVFQCLEGPAAGLARIWHSIRHDPRHTAIEVLAEGPLQERRFDDWDLKLAVHGADAGRPPAAGPSELIRRLAQGEQPMHLLVPVWQAAVVSGGTAAARADARELLARLIPTLVLPQMRPEAPAAAGGPPPYPDTSALAGSLMDPDPQVGVALVRAAHAIDGTLDRLASEVIEPAARRLGDLFLADDCSDLDLTLGLWRLQHVLRELGMGTPRLPSPRAPRVLVVPPPGETHLLGAVLDSELLWLAGWSPQVDFPASAAALEALVAATWFDVLDLALSPALLREHRRAQLGATIARARVASLNPELVVVVSGRAFGDAVAGDPAGDAVRELGADAGFGSAAQAVATLLGVLHPRARRC